MPHVSALLSRVTACQNPSCLEAHPGPQGEATRVPTSNQLTDSIICQTWGCRSLAMVPAFKSPAV